MRTHRSLTACHAPITAGGTIDTTGLAALVRAGRRRIVAFYDDAVDLHAASAQLAFAFGVPNRTTSLAMWEGPKLGQLFAPTHWPAVSCQFKSNHLPSHAPRILGVTPLPAPPHVHECVLCKKRTDPLAPHSQVLANLTDPERGFARLDNLDVLPNSYLGVSGGYRIDSLLIVATQYSRAFLREFDVVDPRVRQGLHPGWPEAMSLLGISPLDVNTLCVFCGWNVKRLSAQIVEILDPSAAAAA